MKRKSKVKLKCGGEEYLFNEVRLRALGEQEDAFVSFFPSLYNNVAPSSV